MNKLFAELKELVSQRNASLKGDKLVEYGPAEKAFYQSLINWSERLLGRPKAEKVEFLRRYQEDKEAASMIKYWDELNQFLRNNRTIIGDSKARRRFFIFTNELILNSVKNAQFEVKKDASCNCKLRQELGIIYRSAPHPTIQKIGDYTDGYYDYQLFRCSECETYWVNDLYSDDGPSKGFLAFERVHKNESVDDVMGYIEKYAQYRR